MIIFSWDNGTNRISSFVVDFHQEILEMDRKYILIFSEIFYGIIFVLILFFFILSSPYFIFFLHKYRRN